MSAPVANELSGIIYMIGGVYEADGVATGNQTDEI